MGHNRVAMSRTSSPERRTGRGSTSPSSYATLDGRGRINGPSRRPSRRRRTAPARLRDRTDRGREKSSAEQILSRATARVSPAKKAKTGGSGLAHPGPGCATGPNRRPPPPGRTTGTAAGFLEVSRFSMFSTSSMSMGSSASSSAASATSYPPAHGRVPSRRRLDFFRVHRVRSRVAVVARGAARDARGSFPPRPLAARPRRSRPSADVPSRRKRSRLTKASARRPPVLSGICGRGARRRFWASSATSPAAATPRHPGARRGGVRVEAGRAPPRPDGRGRRRGVSGRIPFFFPCARQSEFERGNVSERRCAFFVARCRDGRIADRACATFAVGDTKLVRNLRLPEKPQKRETAAIAAS